MRMIMIGLAGFMLAACSGGSGKILGLERETPDEFAVVSRAPLTLPPDYNLRPPDPNGVRNQDLTPQRDARRVVFGNDIVRRRDEAENTLRRNGASPGDLALLTQAGALNADPGIRQIVDEESAALASESEAFVDNLVFWTEKPKPGHVLDADAESRRIRDNSAQGRPITEGQSPIITRQGEKSLLKWPF